MRAGISATASNRPSPHSLTTTRIQKNTSAACNYDFCLPCHSVFAILSFAWCVSVAHRFVLFIIMCVVFVFARHISAITHQYLCNFFVMSTLLCVAQKLSICAKLQMFFVQFFFLRLLASFPHQPFHTKFCLSSAAATTISSCVYPLFCSVFCRCVRYAWHSICWLVVVCVIASTRTSQLNGMQNWEMRKRYSHTHSNVHRRQAGIRVWERWNECFLLLELK